MSKDVDTAGDSCGMRMCRAELRRKRKVKAEGGIEVILGARVKSRRGLRTAIFAGRLNTDLGLWIP